MLFGLLDLFIDYIMVIGAFEEVGFQVVEVTFFLFRLRADATDPKGLAIGDSSECVWRVA